MTKVPSPLFLASVLCLFAGTSIAHSPHDSIAHLSVSPDYANDETLFLGVMGQLQVSTDGGLTWKRLRRGLDNNSPIVRTAISPNFAADWTVFAATNGDGLYVTHDRGDSWQRLKAQPSNQRLGSIVLSPRFPYDQTIVVTGRNRGIYRSEDGGRSWTTVRDTDEKVVDITMIQRDQASFVVALLETGEVIELSSGASQWSNLAFPAGKPYMMDNLHGVHSRGSLAFATDNGVYVTHDAGATFKRLELPGPGVRGRSGVVTTVRALTGADDDMSLIAANWYGGAYIHRPDDAGWQRRNSGLTIDQQADEYGSAHFRELVTVGDTIFLSAFDGLFKSDNGGGRWYQLETVPSGAPTSLTVLERASGKDRLFITTFDSGIYASEDSGRTWATLNYGLRKKHIWSATASASREGDGYQLLAATNQSIYSRSDNDNDWHTEILGCKREQEARSRLKRAWDRAMRYFVTPERCQATFPHGLSISSHDAPDAVMIYFATRYEGIYRSRDNGRTWQNIHDGLGSWVSQLALSPQQPEDHTLFATIRGKGVLRSTDDGDNWRQVANREMLDTVSRFPNLNLPIRISPSFDEDGRIFVGTPEGLYGSEDRGAIWQRLDVRQSSKKRTAVLAIGLSPRFEADGYMLVSMKGHGLFASSDFGSNFEAIAPELLANNEIPVNLYLGEREGPSGRLVYALSEERLLVSEDSGHSWREIRRPVRYESSSDSLRRSDGWSKVESTELSEMSALRSDKKGNWIELSFHGAEVEIVSQASADGGIAAVYLNGTEVGRVDLHSTRSPAQEVTARFAAPRAGRHTVRFEVSGEKSPGSSGTAVTLDAIDIH